MAEETEGKASSNASISINKLPMEIWIQIANNLLIKDLDSFALTCNLCNDIAKFVKERRGPQSLLIKLHQNFGNRNCSCFVPIPVQEDSFEEDFLKYNNEHDASVSEICKDPGPAEEILKELLYCDPKCVIVLGTQSIVPESRIGNLR